MDRITLKDVFELSAGIARDRLSSRLTLAAAFVVAAGGYALGVGPTAAKLMIAGGALGALKLATGYCSFVYQEIKKNGTFNIPS